MSVTEPEDRSLQNGKPPLEPFVPMDSPIERTKPATLENTNAGIQDRAHRKRRKSLKATVENSLESFLTFSDPDPRKVSRELVDKGD